MCTTQLIRKIIFLLIILSLVVPRTVSQEVVEQWIRFSQDPGNSYGRKVQVDEMGNVYVLGKNNTLGSFTVKYNAQGDPQWQKNYGLVDADMFVDDLGNMYICAGAGVSKYNSDGQLLWNTALIASTFQSITVDNNGNVIVAGKAINSLFIWKLDAFGQGLWSSPVGYLSSSVKVMVDQNLDVILALDSRVLKYNASGIFQWNSSFNGSTYGAHVAVDKSGSVVIGYTTEPLGGSRDFSVFKLNPQGTLVWARSYDGPQGSNEILHDLGVDSSGNVFVTGETEAIGTNNVNFATVKYDSNGNQKWVSVFDWLFTADRPSALAVDAPGNVYVTGATRFNVAGGSMWTTIGYNINGGIKWLKQTGTPTPFASWTDVPIDITTDKFGNVYVTGQVGSSVTGMKTVKYAVNQPLIFNLYPDTTVYLGYGSNCVLLKSVASGGSGPYFYGWEADPSVTKNELLVCPEVTTLYRAGVYDATGLRKDDSVTVTVIDVRCGNNNAKVQLCHKGKTICIDKESVPDHLSHGDQLGSCDELITSSSPSREPVKDATAKYALSASNFPNPFSNNTILSYNLPFAGHVRINIYNLEGQMIKTIVNGWQQPGMYTASVVGNDLAAGIYFSKIILNNGQQRLSYQRKMVKVR